MKVSGSKNKLLVFAVVSILLIFILLIAMSVMPDKNEAYTQSLVDAAVQQHELIAISTLGTENSRSAEVRNLATTTQLSLSSQQQSLLSVVSNNGQTLDVKGLDSRRNLENETLLLEAQQNNQFDEVFAEILDQELREYQLKLQEVYNQTNNETTRQSLSSHYNSASLLAGADKAPVQE